MRKPERPPPSEEMLRRALSDRGLVAMLASRPTAALTGRYLHWDDTRYRRPPGDLSREEWWALLKLSRRSMARVVPLVDMDGAPFTYSLTDEVLRLNDYISAHTAGLISLSEEVANPTTRDRYLVNSLIEEAITSSQLEGARTEKRVATEMLRSGREPRNRGERMILNNYHAMEFVRDIRDDELSPEMICQIQRIATEGTLDDPTGAGRFQQSHEARVAIYDNEDELVHAPPPADQLPARVQRLCDFANGAIGEDYLPGVIRAIILHFMLGYEHPFVEGNGRTARLLFYWSMLNQGYWLTEYISISSIIKKAPAKYGRAFLYTETDDNDLTYFLLFNLNVLRRSLDELDAYLARKMAELRELRHALENGVAHFNPRQLALLDNAVKNPRASYTVVSYQNSHRVSAETARKDLVDLAGHRLLERRRVGRSNVYRPVPDLGDRIKRLGL